MIHRFESEENNPRVIRYQALNPDGSYVSQDDVAGIKLFVYETETNAAMTPEGGETIDHTLAIFDTLQPWDVEAAGYNVRIPVSGVYLVGGDMTYRVEVLITPSDEEAEPWYLEHVEIKTIETYSA